MNSLEHVLGKIDSTRAFFTEKRNSNRARVLWISVSTVTLSALATVSIAATKMLNQEWLQLVALLATSVATIIGVWESVFSYRKLWNLNNIAMKDLDRLKRRIEYRMTNGSPLLQAEVDAYFEEFDRILTEVDDGWVKTYAAA